jgi:hypothetical protein
VPATDGDVTPTPIFYPGKTGLRLPCPITAPYRLLISTQVSVIIAGKITKYRTYDYPDLVKLAFRRFSRGAKVAVDVAMIAC